MDEKKNIYIDNRLIEYAEGMSYEDLIDEAKQMAMDEMRRAMAAPLLFPLFYFFDSEEQELSPVEFWEFWDSLTLEERRPFLLFAKNELKPTKAK